MKVIQEWLGHNHFSTTANFYAHLEHESKKESANAIGGMLLITGQGDAKQKADSPAAVEHLPQASGKPRIAHNKKKIASSARKAR